MISPDLRLFVTVKVTKIIAFSPFLSVGEIAIWRLAARFNVKLNRL